MNAGEIIAFLHEGIASTFSALDARCASLHDDPGPSDEGDDWSVGQVIEHVWLANRFLLLLIEKGARRALVRADPDAIAHKLEGYCLSNPRLEEIGVNGSFPWRPPGHMVPSGAVSPDRARHLLADQGELLHRIVDLMPNGEGVLVTTAMSVHSLGRLDVYQYVYFLLMHARRHLGQIDEIMSRDLEQT